MNLNTKPTKPMKSLINLISQLICSLRNHPGKREQQRNISTYYPNQDYVEYYCPKCNVMLPCYEPHEPHTHTEQSH